MFPPLASWHNNNSQRNTYNCMARVLDDGIGNVTKALRAAQLMGVTTSVVFGISGVRRL